MTVSIEAKILRVQAKLQSLAGDERADLPAGEERSAYNREYRAAYRALKRLQVEFANPTYAPAAVASPPMQQVVRSFQPLVALGSRSPDQACQTLIKKRSGKKKRKVTKKARRAQQIAENVARLRETPDWRAMNETTVARNLELQKQHRTERYQEALASIRQVQEARRLVEWVATKHPAAVRMKRKTMVVHHPSPGTP